ncbi:hypothetical protein FE257_002191 [Aspergillus nanangensis]|uniref:Uncharacterized protein n=1 Tax=Aspergillus nanangensis TaxID=2582783 RepID=A0AAD4GP91_ASPNN|nr:hypothetical protein FE257_002191 [Aspergillus nanangensis]
MPGFVARQENSESLMIRLCPTVLDWLRTPQCMATLSIDAQLTLDTLFSTSGPTSCCIDWGDIFIDKGILALPPFPTTLRRLKIRNVSHLFPFQMPPFMAGSTPPAWLEEIRSRMRFLEQLELVDGRLNPADLDHFRQWVPHLAILHVRRRLPKTLAGLESEWKYYKTPSLAAELISRYAFLQHPQRWSVLLESLPIVISEYLQSARFDCCLRLLPWAVLAQACQQTRLYNQVKDYFAIVQEENELFQCLSLCEKLDSDTLCRLLGLLNQLQREDIFRLVFEDPN